MTITRAELAKLLNKADNINVVSENEKEMILTAVTGPLGPPLPVIVSVKNNEVVQFRTLNMLTAPASSYRTTLLQALADLNYRFKIAKFTFDPKDGEVAAYATLLVMDSSLADSQIDRVINVFRTVVAIGRRRCERIRDTGNDIPDAESEVGLMMTEALKHLMESAGEASSASSASRRSDQRTEKPKKAGLGKWLEGDSFN